MRSEGSTIGNTAVRVSNKHLAIIHQFAKDNSYSSTARALGRLIDEYVMLKAKEHNLDHALMDRATCAPYSD
jgi:hypothetical protein